MNKEKQHIQQLIDRYMAAETTQAEEALLADYFCTHHDVPAEWRTFSILFRGLRQGPGGATPQAHAAQVERRRRGRRSNGRRPALPAKRP